MTKLACPMVSRGSRETTRSAFNEGVEVPKGEWNKLVAKNPALASRNNAERAEARKKAILTGELAKYRKR